jgi:uncharacterized protein DUF6788
MEHNLKLKACIESLVNPGSVIAGKITRLMGTCGNPKCKCVNKKDPQKHPYMQLSYTHEGKTKTLSVKKANLAAMQKMTENYKNLRQASLLLGHEAAVLVKKYGVEHTQKIILNTYDSVIRKKAGVKPASRILRETCSSSDKWKTKALERQAEIVKNQVKTRDLENSRDNWKVKAMQAKKENQELYKELEKSKKKLSANSG